MGKLRIRYTKSAIGYSSRQKDTIRSLGLGKLQSVVVHNDTPAIRGMAFHVRHLVTVEEVSDSYEEPRTKRPVTTVVIKRSEAQASEPAADTRAAVPVAEPETQPISAASLGTTTALADPAPVAEPSKVAKPDNLRLIEGVGPKIESVLHEAGITSFAQLASIELPKLQQILEDAHQHLAMGPSESWAEQAALAAAGKFEELKALQEQLEGGRRVEGETE